MTIFLGCLFIIIGLVLVITGGDIFVDASINLGKKLRIPEIIVGATFISIATTLPELIVSVLSATKGSYGMAVGNAMGSVICNALLICGLSIAVLPSMLKNKSKNPFKYLMLILSIALVIAFGLDGNIGLIDSIIILLVFVAFMVETIIEAIWESKKQKEKGIVEQEEEVQPESKSKIKKFINGLKEKCSKNIWLIILTFVLGAGILVGGAELLVSGAESVCKAIGISDAVIGVTILAIVTTITAVRKKSVSLGYGNIIGANIIDVCLIMSICGIIGGETGLIITRQNLLFDFIIAILGSLIFVLPLMIKKRTYRWQGLTMLALYAIFFVMSIVFEFVGFLY